MVILNKIYTKTGDDGSTALATGSRRKKYNIRVSAYGTVDEANATIGLVRLHTKEQEKIDGMLRRIQNDLFDMGADLATPDTGEKLEYEPLRITPAQVTRIEQEIDELNKDLEPIRSFVLPGGSPASSYLHLARTVTRRAERLIVELSQDDEETVSDAVIQYINRLSDFLFVASRWLNDLGRRDVLWVPGKNR